LAFISRRVTASQPFRGLHGRFLFGALALLIVLLGSGILAEFHLDRQQQRRAEHLQQRQTALTASRVLRNAFWDATHFLQLFSLNPRPQYERKALQALHRGRREARRLAGTPWVQRHGQARLARQLRQEIGTLAEEAKGFFATRRDPERLYPTLGVMRERLAPASVSFLNTAGLATRSADSSPGKAQDLFRKVRYLWSRLVAEFRLYMTARVGLLGSNGDGTRIRNLESFSAEIADILSRLARLGEQGALNLVQTRALQDLQEDRSRWLAGFRKVRRVHENFSWRTDFPLIRNTLHPRYESIQGMLLQLDKRIEASAAQDAAAITTVAQKIAAIIWTLLLVHLLVVVVGYLFLRRGILSPLARLNGALRQEAQGNAGPEFVPGGPREIQEVANAFGVLRQEVRSRETALEHQAFHDPLTGLPNRALLEERLEQALSHAVATGGRGALLMLDLDFFKEINDAFGHPMGDKVLSLIAARLSSQVQDSDTIARFGGDEFGVLLPEAAPEDAGQLASRILQALHEKLAVGDRELHVGASIGVAHFPEHGEDAENLIRVADLAMYEAKRTRQGIAVFHPHQDKDTTERLTRVNELFEAIQRGNVPLFFQPKVDTRTGGVVGAEALLRWGPPDSHPWPPPEVFAMAERAGAARDLTRRILDNAIREGAAWHRQGRDLTLAVNLSVNDLQIPDLADYIRQRLNAWGLPARRLELEVTEDAMMADPERAHRVLAELRAFGIRIAVDDYGTGYSSLAYLKGLPVDVLKIDKSFVMALAEEPANQAIVRSTVELGHSLGLEVVAEGVENEEGLTLLTRWQCERAQGYYLGAPMPSGSFQQHLDPEPLPDPARSAED